MISAMNLDQPFMDKSDSELAVVFAKLEAGRFDWIMLAVGAWGSDHDLHRSRSNPVMTRFVNKAHDAGFKVIAGVYGGEFWQIPNITLNEHRQFMADQARALMQDVSFDGFSDDLENYVGSGGSSADDWWLPASLADYVDLENKINSAVQSIGKMSCPSLGGLFFITLENKSPTFETVYPYLTSNYNLMMFFGAITSGYASEVWSLALSKSAAPCIMGLWIHEEGQPSLVDQLAWVDAQPTKPAGTFIWHINFMTPEDWQIWYNWISKPEVTHEQQSPAAALLVFSLLVSIVLFILYGS